MNQEEVCAKNAHTTRHGAMEGKPYDLLTQYRYRKYRLTKLKKTRVATARCSGYPSHSRLTEELDYHSHLRSSERLGVLLVALGYHGLPHAACVVHLAAEVAQGRVVIMVGVVHLCQLPEGVTPKSKGGLLQVSQAILFRGDRSPSVATGEGAFSHRWFIFRFRHRLVLFY